MASAPEETLCEVMQRINPSPYKKLFGLELSRLQALLAAAEQVKEALELTGRKNPERDLEKLEGVHELRMAMLARSKSRPSPKREKVALHEGVIRQLLERDYSLRQICLYLKKYAGLSVNHAYLRRCCLDMEIPMPRARCAQAGGENA